MALQHDLQLATLIAKFYRIGKQKYNGKVYDNVLNIFEELDIEEQKSLLRGTLGVYVSATTAISQEREVIDHGDVDALLGYLKRAKEEGTLKPDSKTHKDDDERIEKERPKGETNSRTTGYLILLAIGIVIYTCVYISLLAVNDDPDAMGEAKAFRTLFNILVVIFSA